MQKLNDLFGKRVIDQASGNPVATVRDVVLSDDSRRIVALVVGDGGDEQAVRWESVVSAGEYVIATRRAALAEEADVAALRDAAEKITGKTVMSATGEKLGTVGEIWFDPQGAIVGYELSNGMFGRPEQKRILRAEDVQAIGKDAIITAVTDLTQLETLESMATADDFGHYPPRPGLEPEAPRPPIEERSVGDASAPIIDPSLDPGMPLREPRPGE